MLLLDKVGEGMIAGIAKAPQNLFRRRQPDPVLPYAGMNACAAGRERAA
jgi:hypothetical protein